MGNGPLLHFYPEEENLCLVSPLYMPIKGKKGMGRGEERQELLKSNLKTNFLKLILPLEGY